jgi:ubiquinone/menaquinone biosynthesis C-methylase UbiE
VAGQDYREVSYDVWQRMAEGWDRERQWMWDVSRPIGEWMVDALDPQPGQTILELAAGPGETGFLAAERVGPDGRLISTDLSDGMVKAARRGAGARGLTTVECRVMDAQQIELPDASVDAVICRFGLMLAPDPGRALRETRRVLRDGGRLAYAVWGAPDRNPWLTLLVGAVLQSGHAPPGDPFGPGGPFSLSAPAANRELLEAAGFSDVRAEEIGGVMRFDGFDDYWNLQSAVSGPIALLIGTLSAGDVDAIKAALEPTLAPFQSGNAYSIPSLTVALSAR